jgi:hypothetical protein
MENLFEREELIVGGVSVERFKIRRHFSLPALVHGPILHVRDAPLEVFGLKIADNQAVRPQEKGVVPPTGVAQSLLHLGPHPGVPSLVFLQLIFADFEQKTDPHGRPFSHAKQFHSNCQVILTSSVKWLGVKKFIHKS